MSNSQVLNRSGFRQAFLGMAVGLSLVLMSCGIQGPAGPAGANGAPGATGPTGPQGPSGTTGVDYSAWIPTIASDWSYQSTGHYYFKIIAPKITQKIVNSGAIGIYMRNTSVTNSTLGN